MLPCTCDCCSSSEGFSGKSYYDWKVKHNIMGARDSNPDSIQANKIDELLNEVKVLIKEIRNTKQTPRDIEGLIDHLSGGG